MPPDACGYSVACHTLLLALPPCRQVLENNYRLKMMYSPDYKGQDMEPALAVGANQGTAAASVHDVHLGLGCNHRVGGVQAVRWWLGPDLPRQRTQHCHSAPTTCYGSPLQDFRARIRKYEDGYETIMDRTLHYIKLIDMVTGGCALARWAAGIGAAW